MTCPATNRCEDYPCCGHEPEQPANPMDRYCENCGTTHYGDCDFDDYDEAYESSI